MRRFARTSRCAMAGAGTANAVAMCAASRPSTVCSISGVRMPASMAGCAQTNSNSSRLSGIVSGSNPPGIVSSRTEKSCPANGVDVRCAADL
jgi:hypothetical protein